MVPTWPVTGERAIEGDELTVKVAIAAVEPLAALTVAAPRSDEEGTLNVAAKAPAAVVVTA